jgi:hypothetical protein
VNTTKLIFALYLAVPLLVLTWCLYAGCARR